MSTVGPSGGDGRDIGRSENEVNETGQKISELEVTAKDVVDRLNRFKRTSGEESVNNEESNKPGNNKQRLSSSSSNSGQPPQPEQGQMTSGGLISEAGRGKQVEDPFKNSEKVQNLLTSLGVWIEEANAQTDGLIIESTISGLDKFHWVFSIESYLRSLEYSSLKILTKNFNNGLIVWARKLFHFQSSKDESEYNRVFASWNSYSGVQALAKLCLKTIFPAQFYFGSDEYFDHPSDDKNRTPMIYCSRDNFGLQLASKLGLPASCLSTLDFNDKSWVEVLEQRILLDIKRNMVPVFLLINVDECGQDLERASYISGKYSIWTHLYGSNLLPYLSSRPESNQIGNSFTLDLNRWIRSPQLPYLTFYKRPPKANASLLEYCELENMYADISLFPPWFITSAVGVEDFKVLLNEAIKKGQFLQGVLKNYPNLMISPNWTCLSNGGAVVTNLTFQYNPPTAPKPEATDLLTPEDKEANVGQYLYVDTLNSWLYHIMDRDFKQLLPLDYVFDKTTVGSYSLTIDVLQYAKSTPEEDEFFKGTFEKHMAVLEATVHHKILFRELVAEVEQLEWVNHVALWAGLGAVRYIPKFCGLGVNIEGANEVEDKGAVPPTLELKENIDHLNAKIVDKLKSIDTAFSLGEAENGDWVIQFGMVTHDTDIKELVRLVVSTGLEIEESKEFLERMSELVKKGIEKATEELRKESEEALWEEGILRKVPIVGTFVNWWSPPVKETGIRGRALNLTQGSVESTEMTYKYHMQCHSSNSPSSTRSSSTSNSSHNLQQPPQSPNPNPSGSR